ncbi:MAG: hypothetical protein FJ144_22595 [Deltaproteobacteria bacterium]|nr:hypothetical protein [Deltaproteobacteria bacterium]
MSSPTRLNADAWEEAHYWEARATELAKRLEEARARLLAMCAVLSPEQVHLLNATLEDLQAGEWAESAVTGVDESYQLVPGDVEEELGRVWRRLRRRGDTHGRS